jgi:hypothetical protein
MAAIATLALNDSVPTSHDFDPASILNGIAKWEDRSGGIAVGFPAITMSMRPPVKGSDAYKLIIKVATPTLEQASSGGTFVPPPTKAYENLSVIEVMLPKRGTKLERQNHWAFTKNLLAHAVLTAAVEDFETVY